MGASSVVHRLLAALLLLLALGIAGAPGEARAHAGMGHETVAGESPAIVEAGQASSDSGEPRNHHRPAGQCCLTAAACGGGTILMSAPLVPVPQRQAPVAGSVIVRTPRSVDLPVADRPPRPV